VINSVARTVIVRLLHRLEGGTLELVDAVGVERFGNPGALASGTPLHARVTVHNPHLYERLLREGSVGLGESYADGWWETDDLPGFLRLAHRNLARTHALRDRFHRIARPVVDPIVRRRAADRQRDKENIHAHYDLGNDLFQHLLDETMMYSCALFAAPTDSLATASRAKLDRLASIMRLERGDRILEIGSGWGGFAIHAAQRYGCHVTTTTISEEQYDYVQARVRAAGLEDRITVRADHYRDLEGTFDKAIAIEMIEAVDWREYNAFFAHLRRLLTDSGVLVMQAIVVPDASFDRAKRRTDFIKAAIFPGGCLPSVQALTTAADRSGLSLTHLDDIGLHYGETLRRWRANLQSRRADLSTFGFDDRFFRLWEFYFAYCEAGFDERYVSVTQLAYSMPGHQPRPTATGVAAPGSRRLSSV